MGRKKKQLGKSILEFGKISMPFYMPDIEFVDEDDPGSENEEDEEVSTSESSESTESTLSGTTCSTVDTIKEEELARSERYFMLTRMDGRKYISDRLGCDVSLEMAEQCFKYEVSFDQMRCRLRAYQLLDGGFPVLTWPVPLWKENIERDERLLQIAGAKDIEFELEQDDAIALADYMQEDYDDVFGSTTELELAAKIREAAKLKYIADLEAREALQSRPINRRHWGFTRVELIDGRHVKTHVDFQRPSDNDPVQSEFNFRLENWQASISNDPSPPPPPRAPLYDINKSKKRKQRGGGVDDDNLLLSPGVDDTAPTPMATDDNNNIDG